MILKCDVIISNHVTSLYRKIATIMPPGGQNHNYRERNRIALLNEARSNIGRDFTIELKSTLI